MHSLYRDTETLSASVVVVLANTCRDGNASLTLDAR